MKMLRFTPEQLAAYQKRIDSWRKPAPTVVGNCELVKIMSGGGGVLATRAVTGMQERPASSCPAQGPQVGVAPGPLTKFRNVKTDGYASKKEAARAETLKFMEKNGLIRCLREQVRYELVPPQDGERAVHYVADFVFQEPAKVADDLGAANVEWRDVVEDTKGVRTADYVIKRKLMLHVHGIRIRET